VVPPKVLFFRNGLHTKVDCIIRFLYVLFHIRQNPVLYNVRGVLGNKCAGPHNLKTVQIREIMWNKIYGESFITPKSFWELANLMSCLDSSTHARSVMEATPYTQNFVCWILNFQVNLRKIISLEPHMKLKSLVNEVFF
jgi:hypothetical protein